MRLNELLTSQNSQDKSKRLQLTDLRWPLGAALVWVHLWNPPQCFRSEFPTFGGESCTRPWRSKTNRKWCQEEKKWKQGYTQPGKQEMLHAGTLKMFAQEAGLKINSVSRWAPFVWQLGNIAHFADLKWAHDILAKLNNNLSICTSTSVLLLT